ncbi:MAG: penicillin acylase family protein, partial [Chloroflexi bacterium]|nr:penicillin acylase family protein [Chloroflexota bacterium]
MAEQAVLPQIDGELRAAGLESPTRIVRDRWGVPHVEAQSARDAFFAQ